MPLRRIAWVAGIVAAGAVSAAPLVNPASGVPVFPGDITDRPYTVLGQVQAGVRRGTPFGKKVDERKIYDELWERAQKLGADAVIKTQYGKPHFSGLGWNTTNAIGTAIRFTGAPGR